MCDGDVCEHRANGHSFSSRASAPPEYLSRYLANDMAMTPAILHWSNRSVRAVNTDGMLANNQGQLSLASTELYLAAMALLKISVALFYLKHIESVWQRYTTCTTAVVNTASSSLVIIVTMLECGALSGKTQPGRCLPGDVVRLIELATSIANAATSWTLAIIPVFIIASRAQRISTAPKIGTGCVLLLGGLASVLSVMRVICMTGNIMGQRKYLAPLSILECGTATIAASAATFQPLFRSRSSSVSGYISHPQNEKGPEESEQSLDHFVYECTAPSKSHFSLFSEASFGPKTWFKGLNDTTVSENTAEDSEVQRNRGGMSLRRKSTRKNTGSQQPASRPTITIIRPPPPPLNRTESQQYLLRSKSPSGPPPVASRRHAGSPDLFLMYGAVERHM